MITTISILLSYSMNNGNVIPASRLRVACLIGEETVVTRVFKGEDAPQVSEKKVSWASIPNVTALKSLIQEASLGKIEHNPAELPTCVKVTDFTGYAPKPYLLLSKVMDTTSSINKSPVAARLVKFIEANCESRQ